MIEAVGLVKRYGNVTAVDRLSFTVPAGSVTGFLGPNGSGKYLYSVARPMPVSLAICDMVTPVSPCRATRAAVALIVASRTASRCASIV